MTDKHVNAFNDLPNNDEVIARARALFRTSCENADSYHTLRLGLARRKALNAGPSQRSLRVWAPLAGAAAACCALVIAVVLVRPAPRPVVPAQVAASTPIAAQPTESADDLPEVGSNQQEMVQDLDFYRWLAAQPTVATAQGGR